MGVALRKAMMTLFYGSSSASRLALECGHNVPTRTALVSAFGDEAAIPLPGNTYGVPRYCAACTSKMSCQCARCERAIFVGDPVCFFAPSTLHLRENQEVYQYNPLLLVCCMRPDCAPRSGTKSGTWSAGLHSLGLVDKVKQGAEAYDQALARRRRVVCGS